MSNEFDVDSFLKDTKNPKEEIGKSESFNPDTFIAQEAQPTVGTPITNPTAPIAPEPGAFEKYAVPVIGGLATAGNMALEVPKAVGEFARENPVIAGTTAYLAKDWAKEQAARGANALKNVAVQGYQRGAQAIPNVIQQGMDMASKMRQAAASRVLPAAGAPGAVGIGGAAATGIAGGQMAAMTPEQRKAYYDSAMMGAMGGDAGLAAAIMNRGQ